MAFRLVAQLGTRLMRFPLTHGDFTVGSKSDCDITLEHPSVSRRHALVQVSSDEVTISDLGSRNGTRVGRKRIKTIRLRPGDSINIGAIRVALEEITDDDARSALEIPQDPQVSAPDEAVQGTTLMSGPAEAFVLESLPRLLESLRAEPDRSIRAQLIGHAIFDGVPCADIWVGPCQSDDEAVLFSAKRTSKTQREAHEVVIRHSDLEFKLNFISPHLRDLYQPLTTAVTALIDLHNPPQEPSRSSVERGPQEALSLPAPPTIVPSMKTLYEKAARVARSDLSVLITGESGTGKEVVARYIHKGSQVSEGPFLALNCASLPKDLLESELFGIERGVATGVEARPGKFEAAADGTLFLDEIGDMAPETQAKILRVLQSKEVYRLGGRQPIPVSCRIVAATNRDLPSMLADGRFREDLYHRIAGWVVDLPPLRHRRADIPNLAAYFLSAEAARADLRVRGISRAAVDLLTTYSWPGNIRQLEQEMTRAVLFLENDELLDCARISDEIRMESTGGIAPGGLAAALERVEADEISLALARNSGIDSAAEELGISRATLYRRIKALGLGGPEEFQTKGPTEAATTKNTLNEVLEDND